MAKQIKVVVADDHPIFRKGLANIISKQPRMTVIGEAENGNETIDLINTQRPDIVILDIDMPLMDGVEVARVVQKLKDRPNIIFLTMHKERSIIRSMANLGVMGYVLKDSSMTEIVQCINTVQSGQKFLSPLLAELLFDEPPLESAGQIDLRLKLLTKSEKGVIHLIAQSKTNREIAEVLHISIRTVETHRSNICTKLNLHGSHSLLRFSIENRTRINDLTENT